MKSPEQKKIDRDRARAVRQARKEERKLILEGKGTRDWTPDEQREWVRTKTCKGYDGQHMKSVKDHPEYAGDKKNIQFLTEKEHLDAHRGNFKNETNGYYNPKTGEMKSFGDKPPVQPEAKKLSNPLSERSLKVNETKRLNAQRAANEAKKREAANKAEAAKRETTAQKAKDTRSKTLEKDRMGTKPAAEHAEKNRSKTLENDRAAKPERDAKKENVKKQAAKIAQGRKRK